MNDLKEGVARKYLVCSTNGVENPSLLCLPVSLYILKQRKSDANFLLLTGNSQELWLVHLGSVDHLYTNQL